MRQVSGRKVCHLSGVRLTDTADWDEMESAVEAEAGFWVIYHILRPPKAGKDEGSIPAHICFYGHGHTNRIPFEQHP